MGTDVSAMTKKWHAKFIVSDRTEFFNFLLLWYEIGGWNAGCKIQMMFSAQCGVSLMLTNIVSDCSCRPNFEAEKKKMLLI